MRPFSIIVAFDSKNGIGKNGQLPWGLSGDLKHFKEITTTVSNPSKKNALIMGRKTWESLPLRFRPLPGRINLVLTKDGPINFPSEVLVAQGLEDALNKLNLDVIENVFVIGGAQVYAKAMEHPYCEKLYVTHVQGDYSCDVFFPAISKLFIPVSASEEYQESGIHFHFTQYCRDVIYGVS
ncbi:MAG: dihydrofolate reductase [Candidatus Omnitrophica bacterium]|nr:dihydrofolate reductase [Candidatus Omnitrophota bacterium]